MGFLFCFPHYAFVHAAAGVHCFGVRRFFFTFCLLNFRGPTMKARNVFARGTTAGDDFVLLPSAPGLTTVTPGHVHHNSSPLMMQRAAGSVADGTGVDEQPVVAAFWEPNYKKKDRLLPRITLLAANIRLWFSANRGFVLAVVVAVFFLALVVLRGGVATTHHSFLIAPMSPSTGAAATSEVARAHPLRPAVRAPPAADDTSHRHRVRGKVHSEVRKQSHGVRHAIDSDGNSLMEQDRPTGNGSSHVIRPGLLFHECCCLDVHSTAFRTRNRRCLEPRFSLPEGVDAAFRGNLTALREWLNASEREALLAELESHPFLTYVGKHVQEYGMNFSFYGAKTTLPVLPPFLEALAHRLVETGLLRTLPNYVLVNRYRPGEGIHPHVDDAYYEDGIASISLESTAALVFFRNRGSDADFTGFSPDCVGFLAEPGFTFAMHGAARYVWKHEMPQRDVDGEALDLDTLKPTWRHRHRTRRTAVTFRVVKAGVIASKLRGQATSAWKY